MNPLGWFGRLPAWVAGALIGTMIGLPVLAWALWPMIVTPRVDPVGAFTPPSPTYTLRTPAAVRTPTPSPSPSPSRTPRATVLEMQAEWERQQADRQARQDAAVATRSVAPDRCCTRPPAAPQATAQPRGPVKYGPGPAPAEAHNKPAPTTIGPADIAPTPTVQPSDPTYTATPVWLYAYCGREKIGLTAISSFPDDTAGTPVACTEIDGELMPKWLPLPPVGVEAK